MKLITSSSNANKDENVSEEVNEVKVKVQGRKDVFLWTEGVLVAAPHHQLGVIHDVEREHQCAQGPVANHHPPAQRGLVILFWN